MVHKMIIQYWLRVCGMSSRIGWIDEFNNIIVNYYSLYYRLQKDFKLVVFTSSLGPNNQICLLSTAKRECITWFDWKSIEITEKSLFKVGDYTDMLLINDVTAEELQAMGMTKKRPMNRKQTYAVIVQVYEKTDRNVIMALTDDKVFSSPLPKFRNIYTPNQITYHKNVGLICVDYIRFPNCELLETFANTYPTSNKEPSWEKLPLNKRIGRNSDWLGGAVICEANEGWNDSAKYLLFLYSQGNNCTMFDFSNRDWIAIDSNEAKKQTAMVTVYQWKERNNGNLLS
ncbi:hypothetical protein RFI_22056 [Reticulomyxa filosa]|uniref:Uncharacterized protein n=1 Tax=Reticulomyxa filosa TaxID=46433 RepID=X6MN72_RETFI|nr:hypothetical protein RFI_22056 [Reticulomyxa filosa]|eukprot:ETO15309.1 hypothetical protein RFI_22056 [Reticulomyxa filosa]